MSSNLSLFLMLLLFLFSCRKFYCRNYETKQQCLICDWVQIHCGFYRMSEVCKAASPLPTTARRMHCLHVEDSTQQDVYLLSKTAQFTVYIWVRLEALARQGHYDYELAEPGSRLNMIDTRLHLGLSGFRTRPAIHWLITTCVLGCILYYLVLECVVLLAHL